MQIVNIHQAKTHLSRLLAAVATLAAYRPVRPKIAPPGSMKGRDWMMADDFDAPIDQ